MTMDFIGFGCPTTNIVNLPIAPCLIPTWRLKALSGKQWPPLSLETANRRNTSTRCTAFLHTEKLHISIGEQFDNAISDRQQIPTARRASGHRLREHFVIESH